MPDSWNLCSTLFQSSLFLSRFYSRASKDRSHLHPGIHGYNCFKGVQPLRRFQLSLETDKGCPPAVSPSLWRLLPLPTCLSHPCPPVPAHSFAHLGTPLPPPGPSPLLPGTTSCAPPTEASHHSEVPTAWPCPLPCRPHHPPLHPTDPPLSEERTGPSATLSYPPPPSPSPQLPQLPFGVPRGGCCWQPLPCSASASPLPSPLPLPQLPFGVPRGGCCCSLSFRAPEGVSHSWAAQPRGEGEKWLAQAHLWAEVHHPASHVTTFMLQGCRCRIPAHSPTSATLPPAHSPTKANLPPAHSPTSATLSPSHSPTRANHPPAHTPTRANHPPAHTPTGEKVPPARQPGEATGVGHAWPHCPHRSQEIGRPISASVLLPLRGRGKRYTRGTRGTRGLRYTRGTRGTRGARFARSH